MQLKSLQLAVIGTILLVGPCCGFYVYVTLERRAAVMKIPPSQLPGHVLVYSAPG